MTNDTMNTHSPYRTSTLESARDAAQKALLNAAARVLSYHAARLDSKVGRPRQPRVDRDANGRSSTTEH